MNYSSFIISDKFDKYDPRDIKRFDEDDAYTRLFLRTLHSKGDIEKAVTTVHESLSFRKEWGINGILHDIYDNGLVSNIEKFDHQLRMNANGPKRKALLHFAFEATRNA